MVQNYRHESLIGTGRVAIHLSIDVRVTTYHSQWQTNFQMSLTLQTVDIHEKIKTKSKQMDQRDFLIEWTILAVATSPEN